MSENTSTTSTTTTDSTPETVGNSNGGNGRRKPRQFAPALSWTYADGVKRGKGAQHSTHQLDDGSTVTFKLIGTGDPKAAIWSGVVTVKAADGRTKSVTLKDAKGNTKVSHDKAYWMLKDSHRGPVPAIETEPVTEPVTEPAA